MRHGQTGESQRSQVDHVRRDNMGPGQDPLLCEVVVIHAEARQAERHESGFASQGVAYVGCVAVTEAVIDARCALIVGHAFLECLQIIIRVIARANYGGLSHHGHTAHVHGVGLRSVFVQHDQCSDRARLG